MGDIRASQAFALAVTTSDPDLRTSQAHVQAVVAHDMDVRVAQSYVLAVVRRRTYDPTVRAWTFTLDGHDFYVIRLGEFETLVYDTNSEQWYQWGSGDTALWNLLDGTNWGGGHNFSGVYGSNVLVGSDVNGALFLLDPTGTDDDSAVLGAESQVPFERIAMAQHIMRGYDSQPCFGVQLLGSIGDVQDSEPTDVTLLVSDDRGDSFTDCGTITIDPDDLAARVDWRSLGSMTAPGRLFKIVDYGALHRIDSLEMP